MTGGAPEELLRLLADGQLHPGPALAARLGCSRAAVWKRVAELRALGVEVTSVERRGYRLPRACELLDAERIRGAAGDFGVPLPGDPEVLFTIGSTNDYLYAAEPPAAGRPRVVFAEIQRAGRGRRGRAWLAPFGSGLTFSIGWTFAEVPAGLSALGLAVGVEVAETLRRSCAGETQLKWPNDIVWRHRKLGGLLTQVRLEAGGAATVVVGLGLNLAFPPGARRELEDGGAAVIADLEEAAGARLPGRNVLAGRLSGAICAGLARFAREGFEPYADRWATLDSLAGAPVTVAQTTGVVEGIALGADRDGALRVDLGDGRVERFLAGDVTLRRAGTVAA